MRLLLEISHVNIWHWGNFKRVRETFKALLPRAQAIHISHNDGRTDFHEFIPNGIWFEELIDSWAVTKLVTYESLPQKWGDYERLDKQKHKCRKYFKMNEICNNNFIDFQINGYTEREVQAFLDAKEPG